MTGLCYENDKGQINSITLTDAFLTTLEAENPTLQLQLPLSGSDFGKQINKDALEPLTDGIMLFIADIVATLIDAGSEREVVLENDTLRDAISAELKDWA